MQFQRKKKCKKQFGFADGISEYGIEFENNIRLGNSSVVDRSFRSVQAVGFTSIIMK